MSHTCKFEHGGACKEPGCKERCPHPVFKKSECGLVCIDCGCLKPLSGSRDHYEIPAGPPQPCVLEAP